MAETDPVIKFLTDSLAEERRLHDQAKRDKADAAARELAHAANIFSIEGTLEYATKNTPNPYVRQQPSVLPFPRLEVEFRPERRPPPPPKITKRGIIMATALANPGLTVSELFQHIPADAPMEITMSDMHRNLSRLYIEGKLDRRDGRLYPIEGAINESEATG